MITLFVGLMSVIAHGSPALAGWLEYDRAALGAGEWWRILTCHVTHWSADHLLWDVAVFAVLGYISERDHKHFAFCVLGSAVVIPLAVWVALPEMEFYRGLSGIDSALFVFLAVTLLRQALGHGKSRDTLIVAPTVLLLVGFAAKLVFEIATGTTVFVDSTTANFVPVPLAHAVGGVVGVLCVFPSSRSPSRFTITGSAITAS